MVILALNHLATLSTKIFVIVVATKPFFLIVILFRLLLMDDCKSIPPFSTYSYSFYPPPIKLLKKIPTNLTNAPYTHTPNPSPDHKIKNPFSLLCKYTRRPPFFLLPYLNFCLVLDKWPCHFLLMFLCMWYVFFWCWCR